MILVDTNVLLDLVTDDPDWSEWSLARLEEAALAGPIFINDIVYAETSIRYDRIEDLDAMPGARERPREQPPGEPRPGDGDRGHRAQSWRIGM